MSGIQRRVSVRFGCIGLRKGLGSRCCNLVDELGVGWGRGRSALGTFLSEGLIRVKRKLYTVLKLGDDEKMMDLKGM